MSTENEGTEGIAQPAAPSVPPVPAPAPDGPVAPAPASGDAPGAPPHPPTAPAAPQTPAAPAQQAAAAPPPPYQPVAQPPYPAPAPQDTVGAAYPQPGPGDQGAGWPPQPPALPAYGTNGPAWGAPDHPVAPPRRRRSGVLIAAVLISALVAGGVGGGLGYWQANRSDDGTSTTLTAGELPKDLKRDPGTVASVAAKALPSVVTIQANSGGGGAGDLGGPPGRAPGGGTGTGFVYDKEGHVLTNNHVVDSAADGGTLSVTFSDGKEYAAEVVGRAQGYDVAVLKLKNAPSGLAPLPLGNSDRVVVGDSTIAIGAPFGLSNTVTTGIISAKNRPVASGDGSGGRNSYMSALQTDASINPGNSGGPLLDSRGAVIGINSAIQSTGGGGQSQAGSIGLGFAIPINQAKNVAEQLIKTGEPVYPVIGATVNMVDQGEGAEITSQGVDGTALTPNGPADKAGLKEGDVITRFNDKPIDSGPTLIGEIWNHKPGDKVKLTFERDGKRNTADVTLGQRTGDN
ncbi:S1C family serine protease [Streptomyces yaizuensis]|uniref:Trypsin-like peptidase domain-containing protein n=1 Tax=Streptomyces yaizuensis TaxID=2989713 RepID=A0ABQ5NZK5_9ACTN|nr:trypsin-like peptidase domain-containing protein [Streptomyces sp. YSPA8]GLF95786.1 trypsin-like peptidase domain-containing protein [Streptomyces sp. YSPA8]